MPSAGGDGDAPEHRPVSGGGDTPAVRFPAGAHADRAVKDPEADAAGGKADFDHSFFFTGTQTAL